MRKNYDFSHGMKNPYAGFFEAFPERITPYILMSELNKSVPFAKGEFKLQSEELKLGVIDGVLSFRWFPTARFQFEGGYSGIPLDLDQKKLSLVIPDIKSDLPVYIVGIRIGSGSHQVRGVLKETTTTGKDSHFDVIRGCLVNFPSYVGSPIKSEAGVCSGRLEARSPKLSIVVDEIMETKSLRDRGRREGGFFVSHIFEAKKLDGLFSSQAADDVLLMLHLFFAFIRGAWAGPVFPRGYVDHQQVWAQLGDWKIDEHMTVPTWLPQQPVLNDVFGGFVTRWETKIWHDALQTVIAWYVEANSCRLANEAKIVLAQCALELLANLELVESGKCFDPRDFANLSAAGRIRALCHHLNIPTDIPQHLTDLADLQQGEVFDGPGVTVRVRNALVHAVDKKRNFIQQVSGVQRFQASQLSLQYLELILLKLFGYQGKYARRGWVGWRGEEQITVPWAH